MSRYRIEVEAESLTELYGTIGKFGFDLGRIPDRTEGFEDDERYGMIFWDYGENSVMTLIFDKKDFLKKKAVIEGETPGINASDCSVVVYNNEGVAMPL